MVTTSANLTSGWATGSQDREKEFPAFLTKSCVAAQTIPDQKIPAPWLSPFFPQFSDDVFVLIFGAVLRRSTWKKLSVSLKRGPPSSCRRQSTSRCGCSQGGLARPKICWWALAKMKPKEVCLNWWKWMEWWCIIYIYIYICIYLFKEKWLCCRLLYSI